MLKKIILNMLVFASLSVAADAVTILANQAKAAFPDTAEIKMRTTITMQGMPTQVMESRIISKGKDKNVTEIKSPMVNMKIVRNGDKLNVTDLKSGVSLPASMAGNANAPDVNQSIGKPEDYNAAVKEGNLWRLSPKDPAQPILFYSAEQKRVVKMQQTIQPGVESETNIKYCWKGCSVPGTPISIEIETKMNGQNASKISLEILSIQKLTSISDALFDVQKK